MLRPEYQFGMHGHNPRQIIVLPCFGVVLCALSGCTSAATSASVTQVRIIDASLNAGGLDIYQGTGVIAYNVDFGSATSYIPMTPGAYNISADTPGSKQQLITAKGRFDMASQYTVLIGDTPALPNEIILKDQAQAAPSGEIALRFLDEAASAGGVDLYMVPSGSTLSSAHPLLTNVAFGSNSGYINLKAGTYTLYALPTGTVFSSSPRSSYTGTALTYLEGSAKTIVLLDQASAKTGGIQILIASDYDPSAVANPAR